MVTGPQDRLSGTLSVTQDTDAEYAVQANLWLAATNGSTKQEGPKGPRSLT